MNKNQKIKRDKIVSIIKELVSEDFKGNMYVEAMNRYIKMTGKQITVGTIAMIAKNAAPK